MGFPEPDLWAVLPDHASAGGCASAVFLDDFVYEKNRTSARIVPCGACVLRIVPRLSGDVLFFG